MPRPKWTPDQARQWASNPTRIAAVASANRTRAVIRAARAPSQAIASPIASDPILDLSARLSRSIRAGATPDTLDKLATALARLQRGPAKSGSVAKPKPAPTQRPVLLYSRPVAGPAPGAAQSATTTPAPAPEPSLGQA